MKGGKEAKDLPVYGYVTKKPPYLYRDPKGRFVLFGTKKAAEFYFINNLSLCKDAARAEANDCLNGKVVFVCECRKADVMIFDKDESGRGFYKMATKLDGVDDYQQHILASACLSNDDLRSYGRGRKIYLAHFNFFSPFIKPMYLTEFFGDERCEKRIARAPESWRYCYTMNWHYEKKEFGPRNYLLDPVVDSGDKCVLISLRSLFAWKLVTGKKRVEARLSLWEGVERR